jgi:simple sugar transport system substrate-binding protein
MERGIEMKKLRLLAMLLALVMLAAACGGSDDDSDDAAGTDDDTTESTEAGGDGDEGDGEGDGDEGDDDVALETQGSDLTFHMITHSDDGPFWSVVNRGMDAACEDLGVTCVWMPGVNDPGTMVTDIETAIGEGSSGIASSLPAPQTLVGPLQGAVAAGVPVITLNSGVDDYQSIGALTHVGQTETLAGNGAGERFNEDGATKILCARQEETNVGLDDRCDGLAETFNGEVISEFVGIDADQTAQINAIKAILEADPDIDGFMGTGPVIAMSGLTAVQDLARDVTVAGFDITTELLGAIDAGDVAFTVDQQQYLQGYLPIVLLYLNATNLNTAGGGEPILTGPDFVDASNAADVAALVAQGTR